MTFPQPETSNRSIVLCHSVSSAFARLQRLVCAQESPYNIFETQPCIRYAYRSNNRAVKEIPIAFNPRFSDLQESINTNQIQITHSHSVDGFVSRDGIPFINSSLGLRWTSEWTRTWHSTGPNMLLRYDKTAAKQRNLSENQTRSQYCWMRLPNVRKPP